MRYPVVSKIYFASTYSNVVSQRLMRKLGGQPFGVAPFPDVDKKVLRLMEEDTTPLDADVLALADEFGVSLQKMRSHVLVFRFRI